MLDQITDRDRHDFRLCMAAVLPLFTGLFGLVWIMTP